MNYSPDTAFQTKEEIQAMQEKKQGEQQEVEWLLDNMRKFIRHVVS